MKSRFLPALTALAIAYALTWFLVRALYYRAANPAYPPTIGLDPRSGFWYAAALMTIPYIVGGLILRRQPVTTPRQVMAFGLLATLGERVLIMLAGLLVIVLLPGSLAEAAASLLSPGMSLVDVIRGEALPWFSWMYIVLGVPISLLVLLATVTVARWSGW